MSRASMSTDVATATARIDCDDCGYDGVDELVPPWEVEQLRKVAQRHARVLFHSVNFEVSRRSVYTGEAPE